MVTTVRELLESTLPEGGYKVDYIGDYSRVSLRGILGIQITAVRLVQGLRGSSPRPLTVSLEGEGSQFSSPSSAFTS